MNRLIPLVTCALLATACSPGELWIGDTREPLRTALVRTEVENGVAYASLLLSNGIFECELPKHQDPARAQQALNNLLSAACREGAKHVSLQLWRKPGGDWTGDFEGIGGGGPLDLGPERKRVADATLHVVEEAFLYYPDGSRVYFAEEEQLVLGAADGGTVRITGDGRGLKGEAWLPEIDTWASFDATLCDGPATMLRMIEASPKYVCLTDAR